MNLSCNFTKLIVLVFWIKKVKQKEWNSVMKKTLLFLITAIVFHLGLGLPTNAEGALKRGERAFGQCKACHSVVEGETKRTGPNLFGVLGRKTGSTDFDYSDILIAAGEAG